MKNSMQLKAKIKNESQVKQIAPQLLLQNYMMERFLKRLSFSSYKDNFILKGGLLIAHMTGLDMRATMDIDATIQSYPLTEDNAKRMILEISNIDVDDGVQFTFESIQRIRQDDQYGGFRVVLMASFDGMKIPVKIDISTGDKITPGAIAYAFSLMFEKVGLKLLSYNLETILAEKLETILSRGNQNTRLRDFYDIHLLLNMYANQIDFDLLGQALNNTMEHRGRLNLLVDWRNSLEYIQSDKVMIERWRNYAKDYSYTDGISFADTVNSVIKLLTDITKVI